MHGMLCAASSDPQKKHCPIFKAYKNCRLAHEWKEWQPQAEIQANVLNADDHAAQPA